MKETEKKFTGNSFEVVHAAKMAAIGELGGHPLFSGVRVGIQEAEASKQYVVRVYLSRQPTPEEADSLPSQIEGVMMVYRVTDQITIYQDEEPKTR